MPFIVDIYDFPDEIDELWRGPAESESSPLSFTQDDVRAVSAIRAQGLTGSQVKY